MGKRHIYSGGERSITDAIGDIQVPEVLEGKQLFVGEETKDEGQPMSIVGVVVTEILNIREHPSIRPGNIIGVIPKGTEVLIDESLSTIDFYKILSKAGDEGYCMKKFIQIRGE